MDWRQLSPMKGWRKSGTRAQRETATSTLTVPLADVVPADIHSPDDDNVREFDDANYDQGTDRIWRWTITVEGTCTRSSTTFTDRRRDALLSATRFTEAAKRIVRSEPARVTGSIVNESRKPHAISDIDGRFVLCLELRDADPATIGRVYERIAAEAWTIGRLSQTKLVMTPHESNPSVLYDVQTRSTPLVTAPSQRSSGMPSEEASSLPGRRTG